MSKTEVSGKQIKDGSIELVDLSNAVATDISTLKSDVATLQTDVAAKADSGTLAAVATSGSYNDLSDTPSLFSGSYSDLTNKPTIPSALDDLSDVTISSPSTDQVLKYNGTAWVNSAAASGGATNLDGLSDVVVTSPASGHHLRYNGTNWVNSAIQGADLPVANGSTVGIVSAGDQVFNGRKQLFGGSTIKAPWVDQVALFVQPYSAAQTGNLIVVQNSSSQILTRIAADGSLSLNDSAGANGFTLSNVTGEAKLSVGGGKKFNVASTGAYNYASSYSVADEGGTNAFGKGKWTIRTTQTNALNFVLGYSDANYFGGVGILVPNNRYVGARLHIFNITDAANRGDTDPMDNYSGQGRTSLLIHGYSNHVANHIEIQDQNNNVMFAIGGQGQIKAPTAASKALVVQGAASQTANLFEIQNSAGTALFSVNKDGSLSAGTIPAARVTGLGSSVTVVESSTFSHTAKTGESYGTYTVTHNVGRAPDMVQAYYLKNSVWVVIQAAYYYSPNGTQYGYDAASGTVTANAHDIRVFRIDGSTNTIKFKLFWYS